MRTLTTGRLRLEPLVVAHAAAMFDVLQDPSIFAFTGGGPPESVEALEARYARLETRRSPDGRQGWLNWIVVDADLTPFGYVQATTQADGRAWVAYVIASERRERGYATEAMRAMLAHLATDANLRVFMATVEADNVASIRLLERLDFRAPRDDEGAGIALDPTELLFVKPVPR